MVGREGVGVFPYRYGLASAFLLSLLSLMSLSAPPARAQEALSTASGLAEKAFPYKALPLRMWVEREGQNLPVHRVPELKVGDVVHLDVDLNAPEFTTLNSDEKQRLRDWSIGWFLTTPEGSLVYDSTARGKTDRGRIDLQHGEHEIAIKVEHERQKFPIFFFVRTRTLESWDEIRRTRQTKASNFVDHFGRYSDVVNDYESLQVFLKSLHREGPEANTLEDRLEAGFGELGFTVDSKMRLGDPEVVAKLLGELETSMGKQSSTFKAEAAGKMLSQMIGEQDLGLIGAAAAIGGFLYRATDYSESYHWSSSRLKEAGDDRYTVMSAERLRHGEDEKAADGSARLNVRSILVLTPMPTEKLEKPRLTWSSDAPDSLVPSASTSNPFPEVRITGPTLRGKTHAALVQRPLSPTVRVWDSVHGDASPLKASVSASGALEVADLHLLWSDTATSARVKVLGQWGFDPLELASFTALRSVPPGGLTLPDAPYLLSSGRRYRWELRSPFPIALGKVRLDGREVALEATQAGQPPRLTVEPGKGKEGPVKLEVFAGQSTDPANLVLSKEFYLMSSSSFHVLWPEGSPRCEVITKGPEVAKALAGTRTIKLGALTFHRSSPDSLIFDSLSSTLIPPKAEEQAELLFEGHGAVSGVHVERPSAPKGVELQLYPRRGAPAPSSPFEVDLEPGKRQLLARGAASEFRLRCLSPWPGETELTLEAVGPAGQKVEQAYRIRPKSEQAPLRIKGELMFGDYTPQGSGALRCRLRSPIAGSQLWLEWTLDTPWRVVDLPELAEAENQGTVGMFEGENLDITINKVFLSPDPAVDPRGTDLERLPSGSYLLMVEGFNPDDFWIELGDLRGQRIHVTRRSATP